MFNYIMTKSNFENTTKINGPLAVYRMEGIVNDKKKVLYLFSDQHIMTHKCPDVVSLDIDQYIVREFNKINNNDETIEYDLFVETFPDIVLHDAAKITASYIGSLRAAFAKYIDFDKETHKMTISKFGKKSRLHYIDVRNNMIFDIIFEHNKDTVYGFQVFDRIILKESLANTMTKLRMLLSYIRDFGGYGKKANNDIVMTDFINQNYDFTKSDEYLKKIIHKIINVYTDKNTQKIIQNYMANIMISLNEVVHKLSEIYNKLEEFWIKSDSLSQKLNISDYGLYGMTHDEIKSQLDQWGSEYNDTYHKFMEATSQMMDLYFLRRFIDKSYVTNGIVYTGAYHTMDIIHILANEFNFKLTHSSVNKISIDDMNKKIKSIKYDRFYPETKKILFPDVTGQCVDMEDFPELYK